MMDMTNIFRGHYPGLAVGGPKAGQCFSHETQRCRVPVLPKGRYHGVEFTADVARLKESCVQDFHYVWVRALEGGFNLNFWIPEGEELGWAFEQLARAYIVRMTDGDC